MRKTGRLLPLLLLFIAVDEICTNFIFNTFDSLQHFWEQKFYIGFLVIQIMAAPIQSGFSDFYLRKKSLIVALIFSAIGLFFTFFYVGNLIMPIGFLALAVIIKGTFGNTLPIAWAGMADTQISNFRFSFGLSTAAIAIGYLVLFLLSKFFSELKNIFLILAMIMASLYLCKKLFFDIKDHSPQELKQPFSFAKFLELMSKEVKLIFSKFLGVSLIRWGLLTFLLWEASFYAPHLLDIDLHAKEFSFVALSMILGYLLGVIFVRYGLKKIKDVQLIKIGFILSVLSLIPMLLFSHAGMNIKRLMIPCYFIYSVGSAFLVPSLFSIILKEHKPHEQGKLCGLMDSTDTVAFLLAVLFSFFYKKLNLNSIYVAYFSFSIFFVSVYTWYKFIKAKQIKC